MVNVYRDLFMHTSYHPKKRLTRVVVFIIILPLVAVFACSSAILHYVFLYLLHASSNVQL